MNVWHKGNLRKISTIFEFQNNVFKPNIQQLMATKIYEFNLDNCTIKTINYNEIEYFVNLHFLF